MLMASASAIVIGLLLLILGATLFITGSNIVSQYSTTLGQIGYTLSSSAKAEYQRGVNQQIFGGIVGLIGFVLVIGMTSAMYLKVRRMEKKLEDFVRKDALNDVKKNNTNHQQTVYYSNLALGLAQLEEVRNGSRRYKKHMFSTIIKISQIFLCHF